ncbi:MAG TPA: SIMPL domain-containing protein [Xanthobacteraceae bacterium]|nr:SIMPL domain-containing protein [Xanthobacteraceae bacterium]
MRLGTILAAILASAAPGWAQQAQPLHPVLTVKGVGRVDVKPEFARFRLRVVTSGDSLEQAARPHAEQATQAVTALQGLAAERLRVEESSFAMQQVARPHAGPQAQPEFRAITSFVVWTDRIADLNALVTKLAAAGLFEISSVDFGVENTRRALNLARRAAVQDGIEQARAYADAAGIRLGGLLQISDGEANYGGSAAEASLTAAPGVQIIPPATLKYTASVTLTWRIVASGARRPQR